MNSDSNVAPNFENPQHSAFLKTTAEQQAATKSSSSSLQRHAPPSQQAVAAVKLKKPPQAPKRFKSSFIFFSMEKHKELKAQMNDEGSNQKTIRVAKIVAEAWKKLNADERAKWEALARDDMIRFQAEKSLYKGPWKVPVGRRSLKDPTAPKRPMSAFLAFSNKRRGAVKRQNPHMSNAELSKALSVMWKEAPEDVRKKYMDEEVTKREVYKTAMAAWRTANIEERRARQLEREKVALSRFQRETEDSLHFDDDDARQQQQQDWSEMSRSSHTSNEYSSSASYPCLSSRTSYFDYQAGMASRYNYMTSLLQESNPIHSNLSPFHSAPRTYNDAPGGLVDPRTMLTFSAQDDSMGMGHFPNRSGYLPTGCDPLLGGLMAAPPTTRYNNTSVFGNYGQNMEENRIPFDPPQPPPYFAQRYGATAAGSFPLNLGDETEQMYNSQYNGQGNFF